MISLWQLILLSTVFFLPLALSALSKVENTSYLIEFKSSNSHECKEHNSGCGLSNGCCSSLYCVHGPTDKEKYGHCVSCDDKEEWAGKHEQCYDDDDDYEDDNDALVGIICGIAAIAVVAVTVLAFALHQRRRSVRRHVGNNGHVLAATAPVASAPNNKDLPPDYNETIKIDKMINELPPAYDQAMKLPSTKSDTVNDTLTVISITKEDDAAC